MSRSTIYRYGLLLLIVGVVFSCLDDSPQVNEKKISFPSGYLNISGSLITPTNLPGPYPVVVLVHGDGAMPYDAYGYYNPLWTEFAKRGIATLSWDKPGVGGSSGNWLGHSMEERAEIVRNAISYLRRQNAVIDQQHIGLMGFSQAGWVLPKISNQQHQVDFAVFVGTAINWLRQGQYHRSISNGTGSNPEFYKTLADSLLTQAVKQNLSFAAYQNAHQDMLISDPNFNEGLFTDEARYGFIAKNWMNDASSELSQIDIPILLAFGQDDLNVDINDSIYHYRQAFAHNDPELLSIKRFSGASHGLLQSWFWNTQSPGIAHILMIEFFGKSMFADNSLDQIATWVERQVQN